MGLLASATRRATLAQVHHVTPVPADDADGLVAEVYHQVQRDFGILAPPIGLHSPAPGALAASWLILRESLIAAGRTDRATREVVAAVVSLGNACPYCVEVHTTALGGLVHGRPARAVAAGNLDAVPDPALRAVALWARDSALRSSARRLPRPPEQRAELIAVAVTFQYLNRMVNIFLDPSPIPAGVPAAVRAALRPLIGRVMAPIARRYREPGSASGLLAAGPLSDMWSWVAGNQTLTEAFARASAALDAAARRSVPPAVRDLVRDRLSSWDGRPPGPGRAWVEDAVVPLAPRERAAGRLALLTAFASYQVSAQMIEDFRNTSPEDRSLIELTAWASLAAAGEIGSWMAADVVSL
jgi:AhpD family alkylhydroperoxidase